MKENPLYNSVMFALNTTEDTKEYNNLKATMKRHGVLDVHVVQGMYDGTSVQVYYINSPVQASPVTGYTILEHVLGIAKAHGQDSIMVVDATGGASLVYMDGRYGEFIGQITETTAYAACTAESYIMLFDLKWGSSHYFITERGLIK